MKCKFNICYCDRFSAIEGAGKYILYVEYDKNLYRWNPGISGYQNMGVQLVYKCHDSIKCFHVNDISLTEDQLKELNKHGSKFVTHFRGVGRAQ